MNDYAAATLEEDLRLLNGMARQGGRLAQGAGDEAERAQEARRTGHHSPQPGPDPGMMFIHFARLAAALIEKKHRLAAGPPKARSEPMDPRKAEALLRVRRATALIRTPHPRGLHLHSDIDFAVGRLDIGEAIGRQGSLDDVVEDLCGQLGIPIPARPEPEPAEAEDPSPSPDDHACEHLDAAIEDFGDELEDGGPEDGGPEDGGPEDDEADPSLPELDVERLLRESPEFRAYVEAVLGMQVLQPLGTGPP